MTACQQMTGQGGWPLTIIMTPDKKPFFAGTYLPRTTRAGMIGLSELLQKVVPALAGAAGYPGHRSRRTHRPARGNPRPYLMTGTADQSLLRNGYEELVLSFDPVNGGFGRAPKFPTPADASLPAAVLETHGIRSGTPHG